MKLSSPAHNGLAYAGEGQSCLDHRSGISAGGLAGRLLLSLAEALLVEHLGLIQVRVTILEFKGWLGDYCEPPMARGKAFPTVSRGTAGGAFGPDSSLHNKFKVQRIVQGQSQTCHGSRWSNSRHRQRHCWRSF